MSRSSSNIENLFGTKHWRERGLEEGGGEAKRGSGELCFVLLAAVRRQT